MSSSQLLDTSCQHPTACLLQTKPSPSQPSYVAPIVTISLKGLLFTRLLHASVPLRTPPRHKRVRRGLMRERAGRGRAQSSRPRPSRAPPKTIACLLPSVDLRRCSLGAWLQPFLRTCCLLSYVHA
eukprot:CAMPEP_0202869900 /NCGR_PEP_ID=MMETSP1391-20130828/13711_1 /ASSEMBLY_ACC=CAM_ASM_000867 /TAXON_ID=1034604 /ORGANISM="Chlamydomonas leiostraca, Strain SAG 11-49" /LENGTH=125 /DNA_ID=CAMNT_0049550299 /DNA_START=410 /DNA_END=787 /DNA_ORIENTATION=-